MRWYFVESDFPTSTESRERGALTEAMDRWWSDFERRADAVDDHFTRGTDCDVEDLMRHLAAVDPRLMWEFGPAIRKPGHRLCITPETHTPLRPMLDVLLSKAPKLKRWEFYSYRLPDAVDTDKKIIDGRTSISIDGVTVSPTKAPGNLIDVTFFLPPASMTDQREADKFAFYTTERFLGEEILDKWIRVISAKEDSAPSTTVRRLPLERFTPTVSAIIDSIQSQLPATPRFQHYQSLRHLLAGHGRALRWCLPLARIGRWNKSK
jgi:hypothetical protein